MPRFGARTTLYEWIGRCTTLLLSLLPDRVQVLVKSNFHILRRMDYPETEIVLNITSEPEYYVRLHSCQKEPETISWIHRFKKGDIYFDIGANVGAYSLVAAKYLAADGSVYAFEPAFLNYAQLCKNICSNHCQDAIHAFPVAFSDRSSIDTFNYNNLTPGGALHTFGKPVDFSGIEFIPTLRQSVIAYRLDEFIEQFRTPIPTHIKLDVDGYEFKILKGAEHTLSNPRVESLLIEIQDGEEPEQITAFLMQKGFHLISKDRFAWGHNIERYSGICNYIFMRNGAR